MGWLRAAGSAPFAVLAGLMLLAPAGAARAQTDAESDCVWSATTPPMREAMRASLRAQKSIIDGLTEKEAFNLMRACRLTNTDHTTALITITLRGRTLIQEAEEGLKASLGLDPARLNGGYRALPPADRHALSRAFQGSYTMSDSTSQGLGVWAGSLGIRADTDQTLLFDYAVGRALIDTLDGR